MLLPFLRLRATVLALLGGVFVLMTLMAISIGAVSVPVVALFDGSLNTQQEAVLFSIRLPRVLLACIVGAALAVSGAALQGLFRNPLADPGLIGIASGAALAVAVMIVWAGPLTGTLGLYGLSVAAFIGGLLACLLIFRLARQMETFSVTYMLLAGIAINVLDHGQPRRGPLAHAERGHYARPAGNAVADSKCPKTEYPAARRG